MREMRIVSARAGCLMPWLVGEIGKNRQAQEPVILLVPEQYTLQAERELTEGLSLPGLLDLEVLSPGRLYTRIRDRAGAPALPCLDSRGRTMAVSRALHTVRAELQYYGSSAGRPGLPGRIASLLDDLEKAGMSAETLGEHAAQAAQSTTRLKEKDLSVIWKACSELTDGRFTDEFALQQDGNDRACGSGVLDGVHLYVYGFDLLQPQLCGLLCSVQPAAASVTVTLVMDEKTADDGHVFLAQRHTAQELIRLLQERQLPFRTERLANVCPDRPAAVRALERGLFSRKKLRTALTADEQQCVEIHEAPDPYAEAAYAARLLHSWHEAGIPWHRMAVATASADTLPGILDSTLTAAGIPHYLTRKDSMRRHGLCVFLISCVKAATDGFGQQLLLDAARSGFSPLTDEEAMQLENYALENGIDHQKWLKPFTRGTEAALNTAEPLRQRLTGPVVRLHDRLRQASTATEAMTAVYALLEECRVYDRLLEREEKLLAADLQSEAAANRQAWKTVIGLLDQLHTLLGDRKTAMREIADYLEAGLEDAAVSPLPMEPDTVMVGEAGHLMTGELDDLILMGMQDGVTSSAMDSLITDEERSELAERMHRAVGVTAQEQNALRQADFYRTVTLPRRELALTCSMSGVDGSALRRSPLIQTVRELLPECRSTGGLREQAGSGMPQSPQMALEELSLRLRALADGENRSLDDDWQGALAWLERSDKWHARTVQMMGSLELAVRAEPLDTAVAGKLFRQERVSVSRLEKYAACPYGFFVQYGLKPAERRDFDFQADEKGTFYHEVMDGFVRRAAHMENWPELPPEQIDRVVDEIMEPIRASWKDGPLSQDALSVCRADAFERLARQSVHTFCRQARASRFVTVETEKAFGDSTEESLPPVELPLRDGSRVALIGKIDRIDRYQTTDGRTYFRIVDNKSSEHDLDPEKMWNGLQLQLMLYMKAAEQGRRGEEPAGCFYFHMMDPMVDPQLKSDDADEEALAAAVAKKVDSAMHLKGLVLDDRRVEAAMNADPEAPVIGKIYNKDGTLTAGAKACSAEELQGLMAFSARKAGELAEQIRAGSIPISPGVLEKKDWRACQWCDYAAVCGHDRTLPGDPERKLDKSEEKKELLRRMANLENT